MRYSTPTALWAAVTTRSKRVPDLAAPEAMQWFLRERLMARVFQSPDDPWVLKGGTSLLVRVTDSRWSRDVDLMTDAHNLEGALRDFERAATRADSDQLRVQVEDTGKRLSGRQTSVHGAKIRVRWWAGAKELPPVKVDLAIGALMTDNPEHSRITSRLGLEGLESVPVRLYPVADHIADKVVATEGRYRDLGESSRIHDLVDLVILGRTQTVDGAALERAIAGERIHQGQPALEHFTPPAAWESSFSEWSRRSPITAGLSFAEAAEYVQQLVEPALRGETAGCSWDPSTGTFRPSAEVKPRPQPEPTHSPDEDGRPVQVTEHTRAGTYTIGHRRRLPSQNGPEAEGSR